MNTTPDPDTHKSVTAAAPSPWARVVLVLGLNTLRGRFLAISMIVLVSLVILAAGVNTRVRGLSSENTAKIVERKKISATVVHMTNELWEAEAILQRYMLTPSVADRKQLDTLLAELVKGSEALAHQQNGVSRNITDRAQSMHNDFKRLRDETSHLMALRVDNHRLFPAIPIMINQMQPRNMEFVSLATLALNEAEERLDQPAQRNTYQHFAEARYAWARMVDTFRLYVSSRFEVFDNSPEAALAQARDLGDYSERIGIHLAALTKMEKQNRLEFQQGESLAIMRVLHREWLSYWQQVHAIYSSKRWRTDSPILREVIQPQFAGIWNSIREIEKELDSHSASDLTLLAQVATNISDSLWILVLAGLVLGSVVLLVFEAQILRPIARVVAALKAVAAGEKNISVPKTGLAETRDLAQAFEHMRHEVRVRQDSLNARELRLHTILDNTAEGIITFDERGMIEGFNQSSEKLFGWAEDEVIGTSIALLISPDSRESRDDYVEHFMRAEIQRLIGHEGEMAGRHKDGSSFPMSVKITGMQLENRQKFIAMVSNIGERKALMENLRQLAEHDGLTGLYNRTYFHGELERVVERVRRSEVSNCALLYIDLDHFKYVNDTLGHAAGDKVLIEVARIFNKRARKSDMVARLGGDEFTLLMYDIQLDQMGKIADSFRRQLTDYNFSFEGHPVTIGCSIGVAMIEPSAQSPAEVMSHADLACHIAKRTGRNQVHVFVPEDAKDVDSMSLDMGWSQRIREAIDNNRFALACQPIVSTRTREIPVYEVLIRMLDENGGLIMPGGFLPTAERFGLSLDIDRWVITNAIETLAEQRATLPELCYTINLSAQTLNTPAICDLIQDKLRATGLDPAALIFEVTETAAISDLNAAAALLTRLRALGCRTALDDFGSGMSSFAYLKELPVDIVKIDGRFVKHITSSAVDMAMVRAMNDIAHALGKETIAEFVEDEAAFQILIELGVDYGQGYHLGRPDLVAPCSAIAAHAGVAKVCCVR